MAFESARQKIAALIAPLQLQELQQRLKQMQQPQQAGVVPLPGGGRGGVTFNPADSAYSIQTLVPGAPPEPKFPNLKAAAAYYLEKGDFEKLKLVNDEITKTEPPKPGGYTDTKTDTSGRLWGFNKDTNQYEVVPTPGAKFPVPHEGATGAPGDVDALAYDIAAGRGTMPTGKFGAAVAARMKQLGLEPPVKNQAEVLKASGAAHTAYLAQQSVGRIMKNPNLSSSDALAIAGIYDRLKGTHIAADWKARIESNFSFNPSKKNIAGLAEEIKNTTDEIRQQAVDAYKYAGIPIPPALMQNDLSDLAK